MASDETMMSFQCSLQDPDDDDDDDHHLQHPQPHDNLSRLSVCKSSSSIGENLEEEENEMGMYVSRLSIESLEGDADGQVSDAKEVEEKGLLVSSESENSEASNGSTYSVPATPTSENEGENQKGKSKEGRRRRRKRRTSVFEKGGFSDHQSSGGVVVITRPKGGNRSLCMGLEEVKACRDLGFELEHQRMLSLSPTTTPPNPNCPISSPGDDPRDVKARLKLWAHAVAIASASAKYST